MSDNAVMPAIVALVMVVRIRELHQRKLLTEQRCQKKKVPDLAGTKAFATGAAQDGRLL